MLERRALEVRGKSPPLLPSSFASLFSPPPSTSDPSPLLGTLSEEKYSSSDGDTATMFSGKEGARQETVNPEAIPAAGEIATEEWMLRKVEMGK